MKIYTFYTDSHTSLLNDWFIPSLQKYNSDLELEVKKFEQKCETGKFMDSGWNESMKDKVNYILYSIDNTPQDEFFIHADCDIQFFKNYSSYVNQFDYKTYDILGQNDGNDTICCGFMMIKSNKKTRLLFEQILNCVENNLYANDQVAMNAIYKNFNIKMGLFDDKIYSIWRYLNGVWNGQLVKNIPNDLVVHHANYTEGVENKIKLLQIVKDLQNVNS